MTPKNGFLTSEFILTALLILCATILISLDKLSVDSLVSLWPLFTSASAYSISRGLAKSKENRPPIVVRADAMQSATQRDAEVLRELRNSVKSRLPETKRNKYSDRFPDTYSDRKEP